MTKYANHIILFLLSFVMIIYFNNIYASSTSTLYNVSIENNEITSKIEEFKSLSNELLTNTTNMSSDVNFIDNMMTPFSVISIFIKAVLIVLAINIFAKFFVKLFFNCAQTSKSRSTSRHIDKVLKDLYD